METNTVRTALAREAKGGLDTARAWLAIEESKTRRDDVAVAAWRALVTRWEATVAKVTRVNAEADRIGR